MQLAYDHFNRTLFNSELPPCLITFQRKEEKVAGYFSHQRFGLIDGSGITDEIALNPVHFKSRGLTDVMQTLAHEMCHLWPAHCGKPTRGRYLRCGKPNPLPNSSCFTLARGRGFMGFGRYAW